MKRVRRPITQRPVNSRSTFVAPIANSRRKREGKGTNERKEREKTYAKAAAAPINERNYEVKAARRVPLAETRASDRQHGYGIITNARCS